MSVSTILLKKQPFSEQELVKFIAHTKKLPNARVRHVWTQEMDGGTVNRFIDTPTESLRKWHRDFEFDLSPVVDNRPFFWHFTRFRDVISGKATVSLDLEGPQGERTILALLAICVSFGGVFLLLPFVFVRKTWKALPYKPQSLAYFGALGLGFMFYEVCLLQKLTLFLGYPTYSLSVTLMSLLVFSGIGSLVSGLYFRWRIRALQVLLVCLAGLSVFFQVGLDAVAAAWLGEPLFVRIGIAVAMMAPLGLCLGAFIPIGLRTFSESTEHSEEYVAWCWAINGFFSVTGSVLSSVISMSVGFNVLLLIAWVVYGVGVLSIIHMINHLEKQPA